MIEQTNDTGYNKIFVVGAITVVLEILAFVSGANALGIILIAASIATLGFGAGTIMNSPEPKHHD